jgi:hypothetical protein
MHSDETRRKIGDALRRPVFFFCDYCGKESFDKPSAYKRKKRHFCSRHCYSMYRQFVMPPEEQPSYKGGGEPNSVSSMKRKARSTLNHAVRDGKISREPCAVCGSEKSEAHHDDYTRPLDVRWLCFKHHRAYHENPELLV